jgi:hypothetical protein
MEVSDGSATKLATSVSRKSPRYPSDSRLGGPHYPSGHGEIKLDLLRSIPPTVKTTAKSLLLQVLKRLPLKYLTTHSSNYVVVTALQWPSVIRIPVQSDNQGQIESSVCPPVNRSFSGSLREIWDNRYSETCGVGKAGSSSKSLFSSSAVRTWSVERGISVLFGQYSCPAVIRTPVIQIPRLFRAFPIELIIIIAVVDVITIIIIIIIIICC